MGLIDLLKTKGSLLSDQDGNTPPTMPGSLSNSKLHDTYSVNGVPTYNNKPKPSTLDWDGKTPTITGKFPYLDNLPQ